MPLSLFASLLLQSAIPAPCTAVTPPPAGLEAWSKPTKILLAGQQIPFRALDVELAALDKPGDFTVAPERAPAPGTYGGTLRFSVAAGGTYRIALSAGAWIDMIREGKTIPSTGHTEGPPCSGIRKIVEFNLTPGFYQLQLSGAKAPTIRLMIAPK